ncbi:hypothetical protein L914_00523 [Phytophthora nicotianae]|uniref:Uncharacterized protein n=2 Tax=Phytophthora nicotianae TaxID=4792 RepID=W2P6A5_PHYNI|nr:hypothetical protein L914_00523 [Phytophthora nicotianae]
MHLLHLKLSLFSREAVDSKTRHPKFRQYQFTESVLNSVILGNLEMAQLLSAHFTECSVPSEVIHCAAQFGRAEIVHWLTDNHDDTTWGACIAAVAIGKIIVSWPGGYLNGSR